MSMIKAYLTGLQNAYIREEAGDYWAGFIERIHGASDDDIAKLQAKFPLIPISLIELLRFVDGTYWREYQGESIAFYMLGAIPDEFDYPCYLNSCKQMLNDKGIGALALYIDRKYDDVPVDDKIIDDSAKINWLHLSDCMNNGGSSKLYIDFSPSDTGKVGQVVMYLHDPDELTVIADSFDEYLQKLIDGDFAFIEDYIADENPW